MAAAAAIAMLIMIIMVAGGAGIWYILREQGTKTPKSVETGSSNRPDETGSSDEPDKTVSLMGQTRLSRDRKTRGPSPQILAMDGRYFLIPMA